MKIIKKHFKFILIVVLIIFSIFPISVFSYPSSYLKKSTCDSIPIAKIIRHNFLIDEVNSQNELSDNAREQIKEILKQNNIFIETSRLCTNLETLFNYGGSKSFQETRWFLKNPPQNLLRIYIVSEQNIFDSSLKIYQYSHHYTLDDLLKQTNNITQIFLFWKKPEKIDKIIDLF